RIGRRRRQSIAQHRIAERTSRGDHTRSRSHQFLRALPVDAFARLFSQKHETAPAAAAEASFASPRRIDHVPEARDHISRLIIDAAISSQVARVMKYHAPLSRGIE